MEKLDWRVLDLGTNPISYNFAAEDVLMDYVAEEREPVFLIYRSEPSISIAYTQRYGDIDHGLAEERNIQRTRRYTGGRGVHHNPETDFTWSFLFDPEEHFDLESLDDGRYDTTEIYRSAGDVAVSVFNDLDIDAEIYKNNFITVDGDKITGFAQAQDREKGVALVHGYVLEREPDFKTTFNLIDSDNPSKMARLASSSTIDLESLEISYEEFISSIEDRFGRISELTKQEEKRISELKRDHYEDEDWIKNAFGGALKEKGECITGEQRETMGATILEERPSNE